MGTAGIGNLREAVSDDAARDTVGAAIESGLEVFDTAPHYGLGLAEERLGQAIKDIGVTGLRVMTKVGRVLEPNPSPTGSDLPAGGFAVSDVLRRRFDFSAAGIKRSCEESLARLQIDALDTIFLHDPEGHMPQARDEGVWAALDLKRAGVARRVGVATNSAVTASAFAEDGLVDVVMLAGRWTLLDRTGEAALDACAAKGIAVYCAAPYNSGILAEPVVRRAASFDYAEASTAMLDLADQMANLCRDYGAVLPQAALQFPLRHPAVERVIVGARAPAEIRETARRFAAPVDHLGLWRELDELAVSSPLFKSA
ncbi:hypothetical protein ASE12_15865 [Aeromicrobium sp. Root236]|uniref:aldo/keto reductase n=1 Tax=Aeromicrobium sp. Root236 TaxID=1736498 RepID=UPI0006FBF449|nr:aldo/keto reductase [Aeromicrobium sp. Root236]KRC66102.1 hypothetical protein ASE12_15865 [Aeromicrobium sp. Root236]